jgi:hypothetical protein
MVSLSMTSELSKSGSFIKEKKTVSLSETRLSTFHKPDKIEQVQDEPLRDTKQSKTKPR